MNEIKRQLDHKMGNTSQRVERIMNHVKQNKRQVKSKKAPQKLYYATFAGFVALLAAIAIIVNPFSKNGPNTATPVPNEPDQSPVEMQETKDHRETLKGFFKQDGDVAHFLGSGNEFASFTETTTWLFDDYVQILEDNGGAVSQKVYRITEKAIELVYEDIAEPTAKVFTKPELLALPPAQTVLQWPVANGDVIGKLSIQMPVDIKTPYQTFSNAIMLTEEVDGGKNKFYYVEGYGLVARIFETNDGYHVVSSLASINEPPTTTSDETVSILNVDTNELELLPLRDLPFIDPMQPYTTTDDLDITYEPLFQTEDGEFGMFATYCGDYNCSLAFAFRKGEIITSSPVVFGSKLSFKRSPNLEKVIIALRYIEPHEDTLIERSMLQIINVQTMQAEVPTSQQVYFSEQSYPITHYDWIDDTMIQLEVANINGPEADMIYHWQQNNRPTKTIEVHLP